MAIASHPISFKLLNPDGESVLGIFDGQGQTSRLEIKNTSRQDWQLKTINSERATEQNYHFELKFRPGTLNVSKTNPITVDADDAKWRISEPTPTNDGVSLYLLSSNPITVAKDTSTVLTLRNINADGSGGSRGTRVELKWEAGLEYAGSSAVPAGYRVQHLSVVNERGETQIPLLVSIAGTDKIFNETEFPNTLTLHITNRLKQGIIDLYPNSKFTFSFDYSDQAWALAPVEKAKDIEIAAGTNFLPWKKVQATSALWWITPSKDVVSLRPNEFIEVTLSNIVTTNPAGKCNVYIHYENIPGYQDGDFVAVIEKSPVVYKQQKVGVGTGKPEKRLHVKGAGDQEVMIESSDPAGIKWSLQSSAGASDGRFEIINRNIPKAHLAILKDGKVGIGTTAPATHLHLQGAGDQQFLIDSTNGGKWTLQSAGDATERFDIINRNDNRNSLAILKDGNVGIGTTEPKTHLHVRGASDQEVMIESTDSNGGKWSLRSSSEARSGRFEIINRTAAESRFTILQNGKVGIGTITPQEMLHVAGKVRIKGDEEILFEENGQIRSADNNHRILFRRSENKLELREFGDIIFSPGSEQGETAKVVMLRNGNVGFGTPNPSRHLHVKGAGDQEVMIESSDTDGIGWSLQSSAGGSNGRFEIINRTSHKNVFTILKDGKVGIGNTNPTNGIVHVSGSASATVNGFGYLNRARTGFPGNTQVCPYSIWADDRIGALEFNAYSDARMKNIQGRSDSAADLLTLLGIEITDYSFKDVIGKGNRTSKKVIGQQVEKVFPQAVSKQKDAVPDIYQQASIRDGWVALPTELKKGERVKLITQKGESVLEVLEATPEQFRVDFKDDEDSVFVFGREVDDFLTVDYDAIAMLNVSATQQLKKELDHEVKALRAENAELRAANDALAKRLQLLESKLEVSLSAVGSGTGSNGNGRH